MFSEATMDARASSNYHSAIIRHARAEGRRWAATRAHPAQLDQLQRALGPHRSRLGIHLRSESTDRFPFVAPHHFLLRLLFPDGSCGDIEALALEFWGDRTLRVIEVDPQNPVIVAAFVREALDHWTPYLDAWDALVYEEGVSAGRAWAEDPANRGLRERAGRSIDRGRSLLAIVQESRDPARTLSWQLRKLRHRFEAEEGLPPRAVEDLPDEYRSL